MAKVIDRRPRTTRRPDSKRALAILRRASARHRGKSLTPQREQEIIAAIKADRNARWEAKFADRP